MSTTITNPTVQTVSPGLWALAWRRLRADKVAMIALAIVAAFLLTLILSATGVVASDWEQESGVSYAPPGFVGADTGVAAKVEVEAPPPENPLDPLADIIAVTGTASYAKWVNGSGALVASGVVTDDAGDGPFRLGGSSSGIVFAGGLAILGTTTLDG
ncbi:MAG: hypothetical protein V4495_23710 [Pseudomonadota bacterium]